MSALTVALQTDKTIAEYGARAGQVRELGFDGLSVYADLGFQPPLPALLTAAAHAPGLRLGAACMNPYLTHPLEIAGQTATLLDAAAGNAYLGLTRGAWLSEAGVHTPRPLAALRDTITIVRRLLAGDDGGYTGSVYSLPAGQRLQYQPAATDVDLLLGVWGPRGAALAGAVAQEVKIGGSANPDMVALMRTWLDAAATDAGRGTGTVGIVAGAVTVVDTDGHAARALARREVAMYVDVVAGLDRTVEVDPELLQRLRHLLQAGKHDEAGALLPGDLLEKFALCGTPEQVAARSVELIHAGATRIEFGTPHGTTGPGGIDLLGREVLPLVRRELTRAGG